jgi:UDP-glucuronate 4-epimerase
VPPHEPHIHLSSDPEPQRILVTGAAGFVGSHLSEALLAGGHHVVGVDAFTTSYSRWLKERNLLSLRQSPNFEFVELDLRHDDLDPVLEGIDTVVNEAAYPGLPRSWTDLEAYVACNLLAVARLIDAGTKAGIRRFVQASTSSVYGENAIGDEQQSTRPVSPYGMSKLAAEQLLLAHVYAHGFPATILRYFSIYGPRQRPDMAYHIVIEALRHGRPVTIFGDGHQSRSNTFVSDCVAGTIAAIGGAELGEIYNIGGGVRIELLEAVKIISQELGCEPLLHHAPPRAGDQRVTEADTTKAREAFGYVPLIEPERGLRAQVHWHVDVGDGDRAARWASDDMITRRDESLLLSMPTGT